MIDLDSIMEAVEWNSSRGFGFTESKVTYDELYVLVTRLSQAEKDAARYQWLRDVACHSEWHTVGSSDPSVWDVIVDEYIDEAMQCK